MPTTLHLMLTLPSIPGFQAPVQLSALTDNTDNIVMHVLGNHISHGASQDTPSSLF